MSKKPLFFRFIKMKTSTLIVLSMALIGTVIAKEKSVKVNNKDMLRKSIIFDKNTPDVFYCPTQKPIGFDKMIVK